MDHSRTSRRVVTTVGKRMRGRSLAGASIDSVFSYGAVDIDPRHLVVWVLLSGRPDSELPEWYFPPGVGLGTFAALGPGLVPASGANAVPHLSQDLVDACQFWATEIRAAFNSAGWPAHESISVGFDSSHRVAEGGGWSYFK